MSNITQFNYKEHWQQEKIILEKTIDNELWGFTIAGGNDLSFLHRHFTSIIVINIRENTLAHRDKQLKLYDIILSVNNIDFTNIKHEIALKILRQSGRKVQLLISRLSPLITEQIELEHNGQLGIFIAGGIGHEYFSDDHGIFITKISEHETNKQLRVGDRLLQISSTYNTYDLRFVTHEMAKQYIGLACKESQKIKLYVGHTRSAIGM
ncbi:unnamed protein product [Rotaria sp. Silwood2]|nr:unnamed protein product [Rotaria sp. Silwood2]CAF4311377.1 unnamed protein product [Rotaria sp. Silwood2]